MSYKKGLHERPLTYLSCDMLTIPEHLIFALVNQTLPFRFGDGGEGGWGVGGENMRS